MKAVLYCVRAEKGIYLTEKVFVLVTSPFNRFRTTHIEKSFINPDVFFLYSKINCKQWKC